jgi:hypothetical protein
MRAAALNDLQIGAPGRSLAAEVQGGGSASSPHSIEKIKSNPLMNYTSAKTLPPHQAKSMTYVTSTHATSKFRLSASLGM